MRDRRCCPRKSDPESLKVAASCLLRDAGVALTPCAHEKTVGRAVRVLGLQCMQSTLHHNVRGFFLLSQAATSIPVCTGGDVFRFSVVERAQRSRFGAYAAPVNDEVFPALYWANASGGMLQGNHTYNVAVALLESQHRSLQFSERRGPLQWNVHNSSPIRDWFRYRVCVGDAIKLPAGGNFVHNTLRSRARAIEDEPRCRAIDPGVSSMYVALDKPSWECGPYCTGNATHMVFNTFRGPKDPNRQLLGFHHVLKPEGCKLHWFDETETTKCMAGRRVLNMGGSVAMSLQRGFERIRANTTFKRMWWFDYGRTGISNNHDVATGTTRFNRSVIQTMFIHHPFRHGLSNVLAPSRQTVGFRSANGYYAFMCRHELVFFESGVHDLASPDRRAHTSMIEKCSHALPCTDEDLMPNLQNLTWRLDQLPSYRRHLHRLMDMWDKCKAYRKSRGKPSFRPIFKLSYCPNAWSELDCNRAWGYNTQGHYLLTGNQVAREVIESRGYEVFDPFPATLHAHPKWYDLQGRDALHSDVLSDLITQMLLNQVCEDDVIKPKRPQRP